MKILLTGGTGLLGSSILRVAPDGWRITATYFKNNPAKNNFISLDLSDPNQIKNTIKKIKPGIIIHTAAATDMEWCEANPGQAKSINSGATSLIAEEAAAIGAKVIYISTDFVFDGEKGNYIETDSPNPLNVYGKTKLDGEKFVLAFPGNIVVRTNIYGIDPLLTKQSFGSFIIKNLSEQKGILAATDQHCNPIFADQLSEIIIKLAEREGVFNVACTDRMSRYGFAMAVCDVFGLDKRHVKATTLGTLIKKFNWKAKRPKDTALDASKLGKIFKLPTIKLSLEKFKEALDSYGSQR